MSAVIGQNLDLFSAAGDAGGPQIAPADVERPMVATGHESAQTMAHSSSAGGVSIQLPVLDGLDAALAELVAASSDMLSERWQAAAREIKMAVAAFFERKS